MLKRKTVETRTPGAGEPSSPMQESGVPGAATSVLIMAGIVLGTGIGMTRPDAGQWLGARVDATVLLLVGLLFFGVRLGALVQAAGNLRFLGIAVVVNFLLVPWIGYGVAWVFLADHPLLMLGLTIYFMAPCTDWFLGFTRLSGGNVALGTALIPVNMVVQLLLYPVYLQWFGSHPETRVEAGVMGETLLQWFLLPLVVAVLLRLLLPLWLGARRFGQTVAQADRATPWVLAWLVLEIFAANIGVIREHRAVFVWMLLAVFIFFMLTFLLGELVSRQTRLRYPEHALLTMTIGARNAPLMLAVTMTALPEQPLVHAALVIGMLVEFPHLTMLRRLLLGARDRFPPEPPTPATPAEERERLMTVSGADIGCREGL